MQMTSWTVLWFVLGTSGISLLTGCRNTLTFDPPPGTAEVEVQLQPSELGQYTQLELRWVGAWVGSTATADPLGAPDDQGDKVLGPAQQQQLPGALFSFPISQLLRPGLWQFTILVTGVPLAGSTTPPLQFNTICQAEVASDQTTTIFFTEGATGCTPPWGGFPT